MTSTDKAKELVNQFYFSLPNNGSFEGINSIPRRWEDAVRCALIAVDEIIKRTRSVDTMPPNCQKIDDNTKEYWQQVKQEIENSDKTFGIFTKNTYTK